MALSVGGASRASSTFGWYVEDDVTSK
jgi:hypothetical protein